jgi:hypothetical protein
VSEVEARTGPQAPCSLAVPGGFCFGGCAIGDDPGRAFVSVARLQRLSRLTKPQFPPSFVPPTAASSCLVTWHRGGCWKNMCLLEAFPRGNTCLAVSKFTYQVVVDRRSSVTLSGPVPACISLYSPLLHLSQHLHPSETTDFTQTPS